MPRTRKEDRRRKNKNPSVPLAPAFSPAALAGRTPACACCLPLAHWAGAWHPRGIDPASFFENVGKCRDVTNTSGRNFRSDIQYTVAAALCQYRAAPPDRSAASGKNAEKHNISGGFAAKATSYCGSRNSLQYLTILWRLAYGKAPRPTIAPAPRGRRASTDRPAKGRRAIAAPP